MGAICHLYADTFDKVYGYMETIFRAWIDALEKDDVAVVEKCKKMLNDIKEQEEKEITEDEHFYLPLSVSDLPELRAAYDERGAARMKGSGRMWNLPEVQGFEDIPQDKEEEEVDRLQPQAVLKSGDT